MNRRAVVFVRNGLITFGLGLLVFSLISQDESGRTDRSGNADILKELEEPFPLHNMRRSGYGVDAPPVRTFVPNTETAKPAALSTHSVPVEFAAPAKSAPPAEFTERAPIAVRDEYPQRQWPEQRNRVPETPSDRTRDAAPKPLPEWTREVLPNPLPQPARELSPQPASERVREVSRAPLPEEAREVLPSPVLAEKPLPPAIRSAAVSADHQPEREEAAAAIDPPPLPEHPPHHLAHNDGQPAPDAEPISPAQPEKAKLALSGAFSFLADLLQADGARMSRTPAASQFAAPARRSAVTRWEPAACDKGQRFWER